jgi:hypothetical protein
MEERVREWFGYEPLQLILVDETGLEMDARWAERVLESRGLTIRRGDLILDFEEEEEVPSRRRYQLLRDLRTHPAQNRVFEEVEFDPGEDLRALVELLQRVEAGEWDEQILPVAARSGAEVASEED